METKKIYETIGKKRKRYVRELQQGESLLEFVINNDRLSEGYSILSMDEVLRLKKEAERILHSPYKFSNKWEIFFDKLKHLFNLNMALILNAQDPVDIYVVRCFKDTSDVIPADTFKKYILK